MAKGNEHGDAGGAWARTFRQAADDLSREPFARALNRKREKALNERGSLAQRTVEAWTLVCSELADAEIAVQRPPPQEMTASNPAMAGSGEEQYQRAVITLALHQIQLAYGGKWAWLVALRSIIATHTRSDGRADPVAILDDIASERHLLALAACVAPLRTAIESLPVGPPVSPEQGDAGSLPNDAFAYLDREAFVRIMDRSPALRALVSAAVQVHRELKERSSDLSIGDVAPEVMAAILDPATDAIRGDGHGSKRAACDAAARLGKVLGFRPTPSARTIERAFDFYYRATT